MSFVKIWVHAVWATKHRQATMTKPERVMLFKHIRENARSKGIYVDFINGIEEHVHCLMALNAGMTLASCVQLMKGEAARWANQQELFKQKLAWADEYFAVSVSESQIEIVRAYIKNQEAHHQKKTFSEEYQEFITKFGFNVGQG